MNGLSSSLNNEEEKISGLEHVAIVTFYMTGGKLEKKKGWAQWLMPVIPAAEAGKSFEARSLTPAWPTWRNPVSTENTKKN